MQRLEQASKLCQDPNSSKEADKIIITNEHPNDIIDVTKYDCNFPKRLRVH